MKNPIAPLLGLAGLAGLAVFVGSSRASAPPVGPLPKSPVTSITTVAGELVSFALPPGRSGLSWRQASNSNPGVASERGEGNVPGGFVVVVFAANKPGVADVAFGLTKGETAKAYRGARFHVVVKPRS